MDAKLSNPDLSRIRQVFESFDEDGNGIVTTADFRRMVQGFFRYIDDRQIDQIVDGVDVDHDGTVSFSEFQHFILQPSGVGRLMLVKLIRSLLLSPEEHLHHFKQMPSTFRPSYLATLQHRLTAKLSYKLIPRYDRSGLLFDYFHWDVDNDCLAPNAIDDDDEWVAIEVELMNCSGIPMPHEQHRHRILGRRVRVCLFDDNEAVSNLHTSKALWRHQVEDEWLLNAADAHNRIVIVTNRPQTTLVIELCLLTAPDSLSPDGQEQLEGTSAPVAHNFGVTSVKSMHNRQQYSEGQLLEMTCGFAQYSIVNRSSTDKEHVEVLEIYGGTYEAMSKIRASEIYDRRKGFFRKMAKAFKDKTQPKLNMKVRPLKRIGDKWNRKAIPYLPPDVIVPLQCCLVTRIYREILSDALLGTSQPLELVSIVSFFFFVVVILHFVRMCRVRVINRPSDYF